MCICFKTSLPATDENGARSLDERGSAIRSNREHPLVGPNRAHVVNAWIDSEVVHRISHCLSGNHNRQLRAVICSGVTLLAPVNCTALSQSESRNIFMCIKAMFVLLKK